MPPRHPPRTFGRTEQERLLRIIGEARRELITAGEGMERRSVSRDATETIVKNIDELALFLTGKHDYFWLKGHSTPGATGSSQHRDGGHSVDYSSGSASG